MIYPPEEAMEYIKKFALLPLLLSVFERDKKIISNSGIKTKEPYFLLLDKAIKRVEEDLKKGKALLF